MRKEMSLLNVKMEDLLEECNVREVQHDVTDQNVAFTMKRILDLEKAKSD